MKIAIVGASGSIGKAFVEYYAKLGSVEKIFVFSRSEVKFEYDNVVCHPINITDEQSIEAAANSVDDKLDGVIVATGVLHGDDLQPEKSFKQMSFDNFNKVFAVNTFGPSMVAKAFLPLLDKSKKSVLAILSARVGSISDNQLGGWHAYRASKAALNMIIKNLAIEVGRFNAEQIIVGLHPGTVNSSLSAPFQQNVKPEKLFTPEFSVENLAKVLATVDASQSGCTLAYDGTIIEP